MYKSFFFGFFSSIFACSTPTRNSTTECVFLHSAEAQPTFKGERSPLSAHLYDDRISIQSDGAPKCEQQSAGYPVDLVWLYPFRLQKLIYIEQSALGTKLNLIDLKSCEVIEIRETPEDYKVDEKTIWGISGNCNVDRPSCRLASLFEISSQCQLNNR